ncbi:hypothetical protein SAMN05446037_108923 [Anaerovirgula multivorans]|uniref:Uncharacterized protein n=1 Tax=Anaerovirgula multivorans TaxID=312168 RepID=A0A239LNY2_9FIRM|nr:hypothetical protein SAMN05446037_108923 [Anaerovirgula multivorans]
MTSKRDSDKVVRVAASRGGRIEEQKKQ